MPVIIKRYQNRKLYNTQSKRYITLDGIEELIKKEQEIKVIDNQSGEDITAVTLSQIIFELEKNQSGYLPLRLLFSLVQARGNRIEDLRQRIFDSLSLYHHYDVEIERRMNFLIEQGDVTQEEGSQILDKLLSVGYQIQSPRGDVDNKIFDYLRDRQIPTKKDLQELIQKIEVISQRVDKL